MQQLQIRKSDNAKPKPSNPTDTRTPGGRKLPW